MKVPSSTDGPEAIDAIIEIDAKDRIVRWSHEAEQLTGFREAYARGRGFCELLEARNPSGNRACTCGLQSGARRHEVLRSYLLEVRTCTGETMRLVVGPVPAPRSAGTKSVLTLHLRRDLRQHHDRRQPTHDEPAMGGSHGTAPATPLLLTKREGEILNLLGAGASTAAIANRLGISSVTVRNHVQRILDRLGVHTRLAAVAAARRNGWLA
jgi:PAS domain S-box-containing protein